LSFRGGQASIAIRCDRQTAMTVALNPLAPHALPPFIVAPGGTDVFMMGVAIFLLLSVLVAGTLFLRLHTLPERMAHRGQKLQFEIVAVLGLLALFTHIHLFWVAGLLLAMVDLPDFATPLFRMADALERMAELPARPDVGPDQPVPPSDPAA
jgi:hypothetical protein